MAKHIIPVLDADNTTAKIMMNPETMAVYFSFKFLSLKKYKQKGNPAHKQVEKPAGFSKLPVTLKTSKADSIPKNWIIPYNACKEHEINIMKNADLNSFDHNIGFSSFFDNKKSEATTKNKARQPKMDKYHLGVVLESINKDDSINNEPKHRTANKSISNILITYISEV